MAPNGVTARNHQGLAQDAPETPTSARSSRSGIYDCFSRITRLFDVDLPFEDNASPGKQSASLELEVVKKIRYCYFHDFHALDRVVVELSGCTPRLRSSGRRLEVLDARLGKLVDTMKQPTPKAAGGRRWPPPPPSGRTSPRKGFLAQEEDTFGEPPPSPTLAVKHAPKDLLPVAFALEGALPKPAVTSATTSFATTTAATSFANTSFMSNTTSLDKSFMTDTTKLSQSTAATSVNSVPGASGSTQKSEFLMSSIPPSEVDRLESKALNQSSRLTGACAGTESRKKAVPKPPPSTPSPAKASHARASLTKSSLAKASPSKLTPSKRSSEHHRVARIPVDGLAAVDLPPSLNSLPFDLRVEAYRVMRACNLSPHEFQRQWCTQRSFSSLHKFAEKQGIGKRFGHGFRTEYKDTTFVAKFRWSKSTDGPLFDLEIEAPRNENPTAFQRKFGGDRILVVDLPALNRPPSYAKDQNILDRLLEMFALDQQFLGRRWVQYHVQDKKRKRAADLDVSQPGAYQVAFFAVSGNGLEDISIAEFLNWAVPFFHNRHQPACKGFARFDLAASRTRSTLTFEPGQMRMVRDQYAQGVPDDSTYNDASLAFPNGFDRKKPLEMSDGCSEISVAAMQKIQLVLGLDYLPTVVQARIFGAKGVWYRSAGSAGPDCTPAEIWINIADSQVKAKHARSDMDDDPELRTLNVVNYSRPAKPSILYPGFLSILRDRGVPAKAILDIARDQVNMQKEEYLACIDDMPELHRFMYKQKDLMGTRNKTVISAGFPELTEERIVKLGESGFKPTESAYMKKEVLDIGEYAFNLKAKQFRVRLNKSTTLIGICDPTGTLKPGEIHIAFSSGGFTDEATGQTWSTLHGLEILVARNPSLRNSDIQKARAVFRPELAHLQDVIVFSAQGPRPLASKLSGGDYDGDTFWVCWEESLVQPFKNAPAPWAMRKLEQFGLTKDEVTLAEVIYGPATTRRLDEHDQRSRTTAEHHPAPDPSVTKTPQVGPTRHDSHTDLESHANGLTKQSWNQIVEMDIYLAMKPHKRRTVVEEMQGGLEEEEPEMDEDEDFDVGESLFDDYVDVGALKEEREPSLPKSACRKRKSYDTAPGDGRRAGPGPPSELASSPPPSQWLVDSPPGGHRSRTSRPEWQQDE
ncbi:hypothetical protein LTR65_000030 [Meristemomyces frigidus]